ncbi:MAG: histidine--tRNA ligase [Chloroflexota bacterium]|nr:histidine--tRNA ligase [Chloroflexota bacterium]
MPRPQAPRGTRDLLPAERAAFARLERIALDLATRYGYQPIETPLFEQSDLFERGVGSTTDVVEKELFRVQAGRGDAERERWALRPEPTAGIVRAYVQHGMQNRPQPVRLTLTGPMFRYDRPQAGRYRQFWQFDVEAIGDAGPGIDAEIVELAARFFRDAGLRGVIVRLNSIGDGVCRPAYGERLRAYFAEHTESLPALERARLATNPLRLLDSKDPAMQPFIADAPTITEHLCLACEEHFLGVRAHLDAVGVEYELEPRLVRGLDYYTRTAFEFFPPVIEGSQQALGGGGRYDGLVELLGGRPTPGIGFGLGLDRVVLALAAQGVEPPPPPRVAVVVVSADPADTLTRLRVATDLRAAGLAVRADLAQRKLSRQLEGAAREGAHFAVICGDEMANGLVQVKDLEAGTQRPVNVADLARELERGEAQHRHGPD